MIKHNNPFNLRFNANIHWLGQRGNVGGFCDFETIVSGARAGCLDLKNQLVLHKLNTIAKIVPKYAPPSENDTEAYIEAVCFDMALDPIEGRNVPLNLLAVGPLTSLAAAVWHHEQGQRADMVVLAAAVTAALAA